ncbi:unnamed protein product [Didymodactylos carnosus]|uniref:F-box domain-containing protein n=1 Tax=Didymodactylos carnosus TaxID=1234261 RepID=A0A8S2PC59_9BILA|nr:unnamed protein product [Didymodactylos carnosus]CAF4041882.1 unnamed protein product [Didymodactylos carnosus]
MEADINHRIPTEILEKILGDIFHSRPRPSFSSLLNVALTCKKWYKIVYNEHFLNKFYFNSNRNLLIDNYRRRSTFDPINLRSHLLSSTILKSRWNSLTFSFVDGPDLTWRKIMPDDSSNILQIPVATGKDDYFQLGMGWNGVITVRSPGAQSEENVSLDLS